MSAFPLLVFGEDWAAYPSSTQHLVGCLAERHRTLWVNSIGLRRPRLSRGDIARAATKLRAMLDRPAAGAGRAAPLAVVQPRALPLPGSALARRINRRLLGARVRQALSREQIRAPVLWTSLPSAVDVVGEFGEALVVYYCGDDFGALEGVDHAPVLAMERELAVRADLVFVSHPSLARKFPAHKTHLLPHGVDAGRFGSATARREAGWSGAVAGFCGTVDSRLDIAAIAAAARELPALRFSFVGPVKVDVSQLARLPNVVFHGPLDPAAVPARIKGWDVAMLPYRDSAMVRACDPLKLREYLASGTPVAAIDMPALAPYRDLLAIAPPAGYALALRAALGDGGAAARTRRAERVRLESWEQRAREVEARVEAALRGRPAASGQGDCA